MSTEQDTFEQDVAGHLARLEAERGTDAEPVQDWYFTFGHGQYHRVTGEHLLGAYVVINGTYQSAREQMVAAFGTAWCDQYVDAERAGVTEFSLRRIELPVVDHEPDQHGLPRTLEMLLHDLVNQAYADGEQSESDDSEVQGLIAEILGRWPMLPERDPVTPAEERTGISDVQHAVLGEVAALRRFLHEIDSRFLTDEEQYIFAALDRIEQWTRGEKQ